MTDDVYLVLTAGNHPVRQISPDDLQDLPDEIRSHLRAAMLQIRDRMNRDMRRAWLKYVRERRRDRSPAYPFGSSTLLVDRTGPAFDSPKLEVTDDEIAAMVFDLGYMDMITRNEGKRTGDKGWFMNFVDGHQGYHHGSGRYGFISLELAMKIAERVSQNDDPTDRAIFLARIEQDFAGRHGEGIMVRMDEPLFVDRPNAGTPSELGVATHRGYQSWPVSENYADAGKEAMKSGGHWINRLLERAMNNAMAGRE